MTTGAPPAILWRIAVRLALTTLVAIALAYSWLWWKYDSATQTIRNRTLAEQAVMIGRHVTLDQAGGLRIELPAEMIAEYRLHFDATEEQLRMLQAVLDQWALLTATPTLVQ